MQKYINEGSISALILAAAVGYGVARYTSSHTSGKQEVPSQKEELNLKPSDGLPGSFSAEDEPTSATSSSKKSSAKKRKAAKAKAAAAATKVEATPLHTDPTISVATEPTPPEPSTSTTTATKSKSKKKGKKAVTDTAQPSVPAPSPPIPEDDGEWTTVETSSTKHKKGLTTSSSAGTEHEPASASEAEAAPSKPQNNKKTFAEKMLPKPRKTGVDDMTETPDYPTISRVMRVAPPEELSSEPSLPSSSGGLEASMEDLDYMPPTASQVIDDDEGWESIPIRSKSKGRAPSAATNPHASAPKKATAPETMTKKQRQNAARREREKSEKAAAERERLATLNKHKKEIEKLKMDEQWNNSRGKSKVSGGMQATVDAGGRLVWE